IQDSAKRLRIVVIAALLGALLATALITRSLAKLALGPLRRLATTADQVAATADLSVRVPVGEGPEEIDELAGDINAMLSRLQRSAGEREAALASARRFAADAGHELRNPLTSLRANLSLIERSGNLGDADVQAAVSQPAPETAPGSSHSSTNSSSSRGVRLAHQQHRSRLTSASWPIRPSSH
ncbi:MAG: HAMP domain-containing protein, partial [Solirubrobacterales bacterium]|nr:HAMP domain-containing protein [Solirubrobacterales bacterium]